MKRFGLLLVLVASAGALPAQAAAPLGRVQVVAVEFHYRLSRVGSRRARSGSSSPTSDRTSTT